MIDDYRVEMLAQSRCWICYFRWVGFSLAVKTARAACSLAQVAFPLPEHAIPAKTPRRRFGQTLEISIEQAATLNNFLSISQLTSLFVIQFFLLLALPFLGRWVRLQAVGKPTLSP